MINFIIDFKNWRTQESGTDRGAKGRTYKQTLETEYINFKTNKIRTDNQKQQADMTVGAEGRVNIMYYVIIIYLS